MIPNSIQKWFVTFPLLIMTVLCHPPGNMDQNEPLNLLSNAVESRNFSAFDVPELMSKSGYEAPFIFPEHPSFKPSFAATKPNCAKDSTFCEEFDAYPKDLIKFIAQRQAAKNPSVFGKDVVALNFTHRIDTPDEILLCASMEEVVFPKIAKNKDNEWLFVVNEGEYVQGVRVEKCLKKGPCALSDRFPSGYVTECKQKYIYRKLVAVGSKGEPVQDSFMLPSCCSCSVRRQGAADANPFKPK